MKDLWNKRYSETEYVYGEEPNKFFKETLDILPVGKILLPADGEGRNGVYAATKGWIVDAFDQSDRAKEKALALARTKGVNITYQIADIKEAIEKYPPESFDVIALIFVHLPSEIKTKYHQALLSLLKKGGHLIIEGFSKKHVDYQQKNPNVGGPCESDLLYSMQEIESMFVGLNTLLFTEVEVELSEGAGHAGKGSVVRFVGKKN